MSRPGARAAGSNGARHWRPELLVPAARAAYGAALIAAPGAALRAATGLSAGCRARWVVRVLGARHLAQAVVTVAAPQPDVLAAGAGVDVCHAASMLALAAADRQVRRAGLTDAVIALVMASAGAAGAVRAVPGGARR